MMESVRRTERDWSRNEGMGMVFEGNGSYSQFGKMMITYDGRTGCKMIWQNWEGRDEEGKRRRKGGERLGGEVREGEGRMRGEWGEGTDGRHGNENCEMGLVARMENRNIKKYFFLYFLKIYPNFCGKK